MHDVAKILEALPTRDTWAAEVQMYVKNWGRSADIEMARAEARDTAYVIDVGPMQLRVGQQEYFAFERWAKSEGVTVVGHQPD